jgi:excisionase family DNA binding protein
VIAALVPAEIYLRSSEVGKLLHISPKTVSKWAKAGLLPFSVTTGGHRRFPEAEIRALAGERTERAAHASYPFQVTGLGKVHGHALVERGHPHDTAGNRLPGPHGSGHAKCQCNWVSEKPERSTEARKRAHAGHRRDILTTTARDILTTTADEGGTP